MRWPSSVPVRMCAVVSDPSVIVAVDGERDQRLALVERDAGYRTDLHPGHPDVVADGQSAGLGEQRLIADCRGPARDSIGLQADGDDQHDQHDADEARPDEVGSAVLEHYSAHLPLAWSNHGKTAVFPCRSVTRKDSEQM